MSPVVDYSREFMRDLAKAVDEGLGQAAFVGSETTRDSMPGSGAAAVGKTTTGRNIYRASNPGRPPGIRTARLKNSIVSVKVREGVWGFGTNVKYGRFLELGTTRMQKRPFLRPAAVSARSRMQRAFSKAASRSMARGITARIRSNV